MRVFAWIYKPLPNYRLYFMSRGVFVAAPKIRDYV